MIVVLERFSNRTAADRPFGQFLIWFALTFGIGMIVGASL